MDSPALHPGFPTVEGRYQMTEDWSIELPRPFNRRVEEGQLVIWRPDFTLWISVWNNDHNESIEERLAWIKSAISPEAFDVIEVSEPGLHRIAYRLAEPSEDNRVAAFYCFAVGFEGHVRMAIYFDREDQLPEAKGIWMSLAVTPVGA